MSDLPTMGAFCYEDSLIINPLRAEVARLTRDLAQQRSIVEWIEAALRNDPVCEYAMGFGVVAEVVALRAGRAPALRPTGDDFERLVDALAKAARDEYRFSPVWLPTKQQDTAAARTAVLAAHAEVVEALTDIRDRAQDHSAWWSSNRAARALSSGGTP